VHGVDSFFYELLVANGVWIALVLMLVVHWIGYLTDPKPAAALRVEQRISRRIGARHTIDTGGAVGAIVGGLYVRIIIMQFAIIFGAWFSGFTGSLAPLLIVIGLKTLLDLALGGYAPVKGMSFTSGGMTIES
jgi:hypothetical protein